MTQNYIERYWRDAKPEDAIKEPPMVARFRDKSTLQWSGVQELQGWVRTTSYGWVGENGVWAHCQVYDAPDPGEGWRLVDVDKETPQAGDEFKYGNGWGYCNEFLRDTFYASNQVIRRRIEQPKPEPRYEPFQWEDREQLRGRWVYCDNQELELVNLDNSDGFFANGVHVVNLCLYWKFIDTGKPVGKEVVQ